MVKKSKKTKKCQKFKQYLFVGVWGSKLGKEIVEESSLQTKKNWKKLGFFIRFQKYLRLASEASEAAKANNSSSLSSGTGCSSVKASIEAAAPMYLGIIDFLRWLSRLSITLHRVEVERENSDLEGRSQGASILFC